MRERGKNTLVGGRGGAKTRCCWTAFIAETDDEIAQRSTTTSSSKRIHPNRQDEGRRILRAEGLDRRRKGFWEMRRNPRRERSTRPISTHLLLLRSKKQELCQLQRSARRQAPPPAQPLVASLRFAPARFVRPITAHASDARSDGLDCEAHATPRVYTRPACQLRRHEFSSTSQNRYGE
jgi:hypothetical protein